MRRVRVLVGALAAAALAALGYGALAGGMPARDPVLHAPAIAGGATGRVAFDGRWAVRVLPSAAARAVHLPYSANARGVSGPAGQASFEGGVAWYRTTFTVAAPGDYAIRFESVNHEASVFLDGRLAARHTGAYLPFEARTHLGAGRHVLMVRADWRSPEAMQAAAWPRTWFNFGGIDREVTIRRLGASEVDAPSIVTRLLSDGSAVVDVTARVRNRAGARTIALEGKLGVRALRFPAVAVRAGGSASVRAQLRIAQPRLWSPVDPTLQTLQL